MAEVMEERETLGGTMGVATPPPYPPISPDGQFVHVKNWHGELFWLSRKEYDRMEERDAKKVNGKLPNKEKCEINIERRLAHLRATRPEGYWPDDKREKARERGYANVKKDTAEVERKRKLRMTHYIMNKNTGVVYVWTKEFAKKEEMVDIGIHDPKDSEFKHTIEKKKNELCGLKS